MFNNGDEGCESENDEEYEECSQIAPQRYKGEEGAGGPQGDKDDHDLEGDREVELLKRRLERYDHSRVKKKMRPNISNEWISKLKERLRILSSNQG